jgi:diguanylate cyclase (GGDEF)-like protein/PAS domain S-box-containing protein
MLETTRKPKVLVVDDVPGNIMTLAEILKSDYEILMATSGQAALEAVLAHEIDLILLDIIMPEMDGYEVCEKLNNNKLTCDIPVIFVTSQSDDVDESRGLELGAVDYVTKPAIPVIIKARIKTHLELKWQRDLLKSEVAGHKKSKESLQLAARVFENTTEAIVVTDHRNRIVDVNPAFTMLTGFKKDEAIGNDPGFAKSGRHDTEFYSNLWHQLWKTGSWEGEMWDRRKNGEIFPKLVSVNLVKNEDGEVINCIAVFSDASLAKSNEEQLQRLAFKDSLTGLDNRTSFHVRLQQEFCLAKRNNKKLALLCIDLDKFKPINDTYGHAIGDMVLVEVANRMQSCLRESDSAARLGGDEFSVILTEITKPTDCRSVIDKMLTTLQEPMEIDGNTLQVGASIGIAIGLDQGEDVDTLMKNADAAMYQAKNSGRGIYKFFNMS